MVSAQACRYYQSPGGCRQGASCKFAHTSGSDASSSVQAAPLRLGGNNIAQSDNNPKVPSGTCRYFWTRGNCARGAACTFVHQTPESSAPVAASRVFVPSGICRSYWTTGICRRSAGCKFQHRANPDGPPPATIKPKTLQDHFEEAGLGSLSALDSDKFSAGVGSDATPTQASARLSRFLQDDYRFHSAYQVYSFLEVICSANTQNSEWKPEDGQEHLSNLAGGNGVLRLGNAIRFPHDQNSKDDQTSWSFQRGYLPLLTYLSSEWVIKSTNHTNVNTLYGLIHANFDAFSATIIESMNKLMKARTFQEPGRQPFSGAQVFRVLFTTLFEYLTRFKDAAKNPAACDLVQQVAGWFDEWLRGVESPATFQDEITTFEDDVRAFLVKNLTRTKGRVLGIIEWSQHPPSQRRNRFKPPNNALGHPLSSARVANRDGNASPSHIHVPPAVASLNHHIQSPNDRNSPTPPPDPQRDSQRDFDDIPRSYVSPSPAQPSGSSHGFHPPPAGGRKLLSEWLPRCDQGERGESNDNFAGLLPGFTAEKIYRLSDLKDWSEENFLAMEFPTTPGGPTFRMARGTAIRLRQYVAADL